MGIAIGLIGVVTIVMERRAAIRQREFLAVQAARFRDRQQPPALIAWEGRTFRMGDRVRIAKWAGTFKPEETRHPVEVDARSGQTGVIVRGERRTSTRYLRIDPNEPMQIVLVRWSPQKWKVNLQERWIELPEFEATIHVSHLEVVR
ncbi:MAG TPA: hypothetical protein VEK11_20850 [Thermoanaerobaculia bacterium]|nr:hypothetical protein [Thermoanaerobaculia bacterium]